MASTAGGAGSISAAVAAAAVRSAGLVRGGGGGSGSGYRRASRFVYVHMQPRPVNMAESREVLRLLKRFGEVVMFRHLKVSLIFLHVCAGKGNRRREARSLVDRPSRSFWRGLFLCGLVIDVEFGWVSYLGVLRGFAVTMTS